MKRYLLLASSVAVGACTKTSNRVPSLISDPAAFSTRGAPADGVIKIIQLQLPALMENAESRDGKWIISPKAKDAILKEQKDAEKELLKKIPQARILFRYRMTFNGLAVMVSQSDLQKVASLKGVRALHTSSRIPQPEAFQKMEAQKNLESALVEASSTGWIGAIKLNEQGITGKGIKIGIVDTGIDYTHKMFGGSGLPSDYQDNDKSMIEPGSFPTAKVQGGIDLSGDKWLKQGDLEIPQPDPDPLDADEHGTHVAGTAAGVGDGIHTYNGVAPDAALYAIKVFPKGGQTTDEIVMAALEYAVDPSGDLDPSDRLDVLNLSLGSSFGMPVDRPYPIALKTLEKAGVAVVISAGNSGDVPFIVGSPSTLYEGQLSIAASVDNDGVNWQFSASSVVLKGETLSFESKWAPTCDKPDAFLGVSGDLVYIGLADQDLPPEVEAALAGKIALIDRGVVSFQEKVDRALKAKAKGVVIVNKNESEPVSPSVSQVSKDLPIVMISLKNGQAIKEALKSQTVSFSFNNGKKIEKPELIDRITGFSSRGPRLGDGLIKPQISAPGQNILSAGAGKGSEGIRMSGTSMAAPHMAGVMALMKQALPKASVSELNTRLMNSSKILQGKSGYADVANQGAGRVQVDLAVANDVLVTPNSLSLGFVDKDASRSLSKKIVVENKSSEDRVYAISALSKDLIKVKTKNTLMVQAHSKSEFTVEFEYLGKESSEVDGFILLSDVSGKKLASVPFLGIIRDDLELSARYNPLRRDTTINNRSGSDVEILKDFKLLGTSKISNQKLDVGTENPCDLRSAAARILDEDGQKTLQIAISVQTKHEINTLCEPSIQMDLNNDGKTDIEAVLSSDLSTLANGPSLEHATGTAVMDYSKAKAIALWNQAEAKKEKPEIKPFTEAVVDLSPQKLYKMSTVQVLNIPLEALSKALGGDLPSSVGVKVAMQSFGDEFLNGDKWQDLDVGRLAVTKQATETLKHGGTLSLKKTSQSDVVYVPGSKIGRGLFVDGGIETILLK